jgi:hypothetical protein
MFHPLDIFEIDSNGGILWRGAAVDFKAARGFIEQLALSASGEYLILNQHTGQRQRVRVGCRDFNGADRSGYTDHGNGVNL